MGRYIDQSLEEIGLLALGVSSRWQIDIDECINTGEYLMELDGPHFYFVFQLAGLDSISKMSRYLADGLQRKKSGQILDGDNEGITIGQYESSSVLLIWDDEESIRCFLVSGSDDKSAMRYTFDEADIGDLLSALNQVADDLP